MLCHAALHPVCLQGQCSSSWVRQQGGRGCPHRLHPRAGPWRSRCRCPGGCCCPPAAARHHGSHPGQGQGLSSHVTPPGLQVAQASLARTLEVLQGHQRTPGVSGGDRGDRGGDRGNPWGERRRHSSGLTKQCLVFRRAANQPCALQCGVHMQPCSWSCVDRNTAMTACSCTHGCPMSRSALLCFSAA
jgi:hypothetical protein